MIITPYYTEGNKHSKTIIDPYTKLLDSRIILLFNEINDDLAASVIAQLLLLEAANNTEPISIYINSPGGAVTAGLAILDVMKSIKSPIKTICVGACCSMAAVILAGGTKGERYALPHSEIMIHQPLGGTHGQATDIIIHAERIKVFKSTLSKMLSDFSGQSLEKVMTDTERDNFMSAQAALEYGLIDKII